MPSNLSVQHNLLGLLAGPLELSFVSDDGSTVRRETLHCAVWQQLLLFHSNLLVSLGSSVSCLIYPLSTKVTETEKNIPAEEKMKPDARNLTDKDLFGNMKSISSLKQSGGFTGQPVSTTRGRLSERVGGFRQIKADMETLTTKSNNMFD